MSEPTNFNEWLRSQVRYSTFLESIEGLQEDAQEFLIHHAPKMTRTKEVPDTLDFLRGAYFHLGFENLGLDEPDLAALYRAFSGSGVGIPGTRFKLRYHGFAAYTLIEPKQGSEPELPVHWRQIVAVMSEHDEFTWIGKRIPPEQVSNVDWSRYWDVGDGWQLNSPGVAE